MRLSSPCSWGAICRRCRRGALWLRYGRGRLVRPCIWRTGYRWQHDPPDGDGPELTRSLIRLRRQPFLFEPPPCTRAVVNHIRPAVWVVAVKHKLIRFDEKFPSESHLIDSTRCLIGRNSEDADHLISDSAMFHDRRERGLDRGFGQQATGHLRQTDGKLFPARLRRLIPFRYVLVTGGVAHRSTPNRLSGGSRVPRYTNPVRYVAGDARRGKGHSGRGGLRQARPSRVVPRSPPSDARD